MLVLSRKINEEIVIGDNIRVQVLDIRGGRVRLGVAAPAQVTILRAEIAQGRPNSADLQPASGQAEDPGLLVCESLPEAYMAYAG